MKCPLCNRTIRKDIEGRMRHYIQHHPQRVEKVLNAILENPFRFGAELAEFVSKQPGLLQRTLRGIQ